MFDIFSVMWYNPGSTCSGDMYKNVGSGQAPLFIRAAPTALGSLTIWKGDVMNLINNICILTIITVTLAGIYMIVQYRGLLKLSEGTAEMSNLAARIRSGSKVFTKRMFKYVLIAAAVLLIVISFAVERWAGLTFGLGVVFTTISILVGMSVATYTNVRATAAAKAGVEDPNGTEEKALAKTVNVTIKGSQICGIIVHSSSMLGLSLIVIGSLLFSGIECFAPSGKTNVIPIVARLTSYSLGWSLVAMFSRVAGGIFTKAADIGADLIGKVFMHFDEDDPRNPAVIADQVGDNVNDIEGNQADLGESFTAAPVTTIVTAAVLYGSDLNDTALLSAAVVYPFVLALGGLISSIVGLFYASHVKESKDPGKQLNASMYIAVVGTLASAFVGSYFLFGRTNLAPADFRFGWLSLFVSTLIGIAAGVAVGFIASYYTDINSKWAERVAEMANNGSALCISMAIAGGLISCFFEIAVVAIGVYAASAIAGPYGRAVMALGMLSFIAQPIAADAFGPVSDNAGGIAEYCCKSDHRIRQITDKNDAKGNSTAAVGKGFAISGAAAVVLTQLNTYKMAYGGLYIDISSDAPNLGGQLGSGLMAMFCGLLALFTIRAARKMADEVKRQFAIKEVAEGLREPDAGACIDISTSNGLKYMIIPVVINLGATILLGFIFGPECLGGAQAATLYVGLPFAILFSNAGGLADNAKKRFEAGLVPGFEPGTEKYDKAHDAAVQADTVGDWMKDVVAVSIDIFMKIMGTTALMLAPLFAAYHILP